MSQQSAQKSALGKWAFKNWYPVYSPTIFNEVPVGEAPAEEASKLLNRTIGVTLFDITKDLSHLTIKLTFQIDRVEGDRAFTRFKEMELARDYIRSLVRRGSSKVMAIQDVTTSDGAEIIEELRPLPDDFIVRKLRYDAFFGTSLDYFLRVNGLRNLVIVGTVANICVLHTAGSAALNWYNVVLPMDGVSALTDFDLYSTLRQVSFLYKGTITRTTDIKFT